MSSTMVAVVQLVKENDWFKLDRRTRQGYLWDIEKLVATHPGVQCRWFDSESWSGGVSQFVVCEFVDLRDYHQLWLELREHPLLAFPYARIARVSLGLERSILEKDIVESRGPR